jgi:hypothetical protein
VLFVEEVVVVPAQQHEVVGFGFAVVEPVGGVVGVARAGGDRTAGPAASVVTDEQRVEQWLGVDSLAPPVVDDDAVWVGDVAVDVAVAGHAAHGLGGDDGGVGVGVEYGAA